MNIETMPLGLLQTNCYLVYNEQEALIIDPGGEANKVIQFLKSKNVTPQAILLTHAHYDHIGAVGELRDHYKIGVYLHEAEADWLENPPMGGGSIEMKTRRPDHLLVPSKMSIGSFHFEVVHTPGHSPGSVSFIFHDDESVFSGDVLFQQGVGRTDLLGGSFEVLAKGIRKHLYKLSDTYTVYSGHGLKSTIGFQKKNNPFVPAE